MLRWIAAVLFTGKPVTVRQVHMRHKRVSLEGLTRLVVQLLLIRSAELMQRKPKRLRFFLHGRDLKRRHYIRSLLGAHLRRALKPKSLAARIDALIRVLRDLDLYARHLMKRRITRLWNVKPAPTPAAAILSAPILALAFTDSS